MNGIYDKLKRITVSETHPYLYITLRLNEDLLRRRYYNPNIDGHFPSKTHL